MNVVLEAQHAMTFLQLWILEGGGGRLSQEQIQGRAWGVEGAKSPEALEVQQLTLAKKMPIIHPRGPFTPNYNFVNFVD